MIIYFGTLEGQVTNHKQNKKCYTYTIIEE
jgi:hypothetical protein